MPPTRFPLVHKVVVPVHSTAGRIDCAAATVRFEPQSGHRDAKPRVSFLLSVPVVVLLGQFASLQTSRKHQGKVGGT